MFPVSGLSAPVARGTTIYHSRREALSEKVTVAGGRTHLCKPQIIISAVFWVSFSAMSIAPLIAKLPGVCSTIYKK